jgi:hypothetical protein
MLLVALACSERPGFGPDGTDGFTAEEPPTGAPTSGMDLGDGPEVVVPIADQEILFTVEPPYEFYTVWDEAFADLDGDGFTDAIVDLSAPHDAEVIHSLQVIVRGPLEPGTSLPSDAWIAHDSSEIWLVPGELTGDGQVDLVVELDPDGGYTADVYREVWLVPGPFDGNLTPGPSWIAFEEYLNWSWWDANHDGTRDLIVDTTWTEPYESGELEITWGPVSRWSGPADVIVTPLCRDGAVPRFPRYGDLRFSGDLDGNCTPELGVDPFGLHCGISCGAFTVSLPTAGEIDPFDSPSAYDWLVPLGYAVGDWTGDGLPEMLIDDDLLLSPITLGDGEVHASATIDGASAWDVFGPIDLDLGEDGVLDAFGVLDGSFVVFEADPAQLTAPTVPLGFELATFDRATIYLDRGHAWAAILDPETETARRVDLGPAAPL